MRAAASPSAPVSQPASTTARWQHGACALAAAALLALAAAPAAQAGPLVFAPFDGSGNLVLFDAASGDGGWVGSVEQFPEPGLTDPLSLVSVVSFSVDSLTQMLSGQFTFTRSADLGATLFGQVSASGVGADFLASGGQIALDYSIDGGTGDFARASGFGLSFLQFDPAGGFNGGLDNYGESGLLAFAVPEPATLPLIAGALLALGLLRLRRPG